MTIVAFVQRIMRRLLLPKKRKRPADPDVPPDGLAVQPAYLTVKWQTREGIRTIKRIHVDRIEWELLQLMRRGHNVTVWSEGPNRRKIGWAWNSNHTRLQLMEVRDEN